MRQRDDLLATAARLAGDWGLGETAPSARELAGRGNGHRLEPGQRGQPQRPGEKTGEQTGPNPTDRGKPGSRYRLVVDRHGIPLAVRLSVANAHDSTPVLPLVDAISSIHGSRGKPGRLRKRPAKLRADRAYDYAPLRRMPRARDITPRIARRGAVRLSGWGHTVGWSNAVLPGCSAAAGSESATNGGRACSTWPVP